MYVYKIDTVSIAWIFIILGTIYLNYHFRQENHSARMWCLQENAIWVSCELGRSQQNVRTDKYLYGNVITESIQCTRCTPPFFKSNNIRSKLCKTSKGISLVVWCLWHFDVSVFVATNISSFIFSLRIFLQMSFQRQTFKIFAAFVQRFVELS